MSTPDEIDAWFTEAGEREAELRRVDALVRAAAPGIDRQPVPVGKGAESRADRLGKVPCGRSCTRFTVVDVVARPGPGAAGTLAPVRRVWRTAP